MENLPLHPALAHLPIGLVFVLPFVTIIFAILFKKKIVTQHAIIFVLMLHSLLAVSIHLASAEGEKDRVKVKKIMEVEPIKTHEQEAEVFMFMTYISLLLSVAISLGKLNNWTILILLLMQFKLIDIAIQVGRTGGELVYIHGAADVFINEYDIKNSQKARR